MRGDHPNCNALSWEEQLIFESLRRTLACFLSGRQLNSDVYHFHIRKNISNFAYSVNRKMKKSQNAGKFDKCDFSYSKIIVFLDKKAKTHYFVL